MKKILITFVTVILGFISGVFYSLVNEKEINLELTNKKENLDKNFGYYSIIDRWISILEQGKKIETYFGDFKYKTVAIYGVGKLGNHLLTQLKDSSIRVEYCIDKNAQSRYLNNLSIKTIEDELAYVDVIIVTALMDYEEIEAKLKSKTSYKIISLEEIINYLS